MKLFFSFSLSLFLSVCCLSVLSERFSFLLLLLSACVCLIVETVSVGFNDVESVDVGWKDQGIFWSWDRIICRAVR